MQTFRMDEGLAAFFQRELESKKAQSYDVLRAPLKGMQLVPVDSSAGAGAEVITYQQYDMTGIAKVIANYADDLPRVDISGKEFSARVKSVGNSYGYSLQEIRAAQTAGKPLEARRAEAAVRAMQEEWNRILFYGDSAHGLQGWLTNPNIPKVVASANGGDTSWLDANGALRKTAAEVLSDLNGLVNSIVTLTNERHKPNRVVLPVQHYSAIASTNAGMGTDTTILKFFEMNNPYMSEGSVVPANELSEAQLAAVGLSGAGAGQFEGNIAIAYEADPRNLTFEMPVPFEDFPPQERNLAFVVNCHSRVAGVLIYYPLSMAISEGL